MGKVKQNAAAGRETSPCHVLRFRECGVRSFEVTFTDIEGEKTGYQPYRSLEDLRRTILKALHAASEVQQNFIVRPSLKQPQLVQLDDLDSEKAERVAPHAFMVLEYFAGKFSGMDCGE